MNPEIAPIHDPASPDDLLKSIQQAAAGLTLAQLLARHPAVARRTAQRWLSQWVAKGAIVGRGDGRARRYLALNPAVNPALAATGMPGGIQDSFPAYIPLSADSHDILAYVDQPLEARKPVGYQHDFLAA